MKKIFLILSFLAGCSSVKVYPVGQLVDVHKKLLSENSKAYLKESGVNDKVPAEVDKDQFYGQLAHNENYKKYLQSECLILLHKEYALNFERPVYAANPEWNNIENFYYMLINFQSQKKEILVDETMECHLAINKMKEVTDYEIKKSYLQFQKVQ